MSHVNWYRSIEERDQSPAEVDRNDDGRSDFNRRDFLKAAGFSLAGAAAACTQSPLREAVPYSTAPEEIVPGRAYWMATTCHGCPARCGMLVKCRDGRPIKVEGNPEHPVSRGGLCAVGQATVLELYDTLRLAGPTLHSDTSDWTTVDKFVREKLASAKRVRLVSTTLSSPTFDRLATEFLAKFEDGRRVVYDVPSASAILDAHERTHGARLLPRYRFDRADVVVSFDADFLGTWISPVEFTKEWSAKRPWHAQLEARLSVTGSKADQRVRLHPDEMTAVLAWLAGIDKEPPLKPVVLDRIRKGLEEARGRSLVISGSQRVDDQLLVNQINERLGNYGTTVDLDNPSNQRQGNDRDLAIFVADLRSNAIDAVIVVDANPVYDLPEGEEIGKLFARLPLVVSLASHIDETSRLAHAVCPAPHFLESWNDSEPVAGLYTVTQPAIAPLRDTRAAIESLAAWGGTPARAYDLVRTTALAADWDKTLHDGFKVGGPLARPEIAYQQQDLTGIRAGQRPAVLGGSFTPILYSSIAMLDGRHAHNGWLHELPDPISKVTWDNFASFSPDAAKQLGIRDGDVVSINGVVDLPAFVQPGQHDGVVAIALGYGRMGTDRFANIGPKWILGKTHIAPGQTIGKRVVQLSRYASVTVKKTGRFQKLATTQQHNTIDGDRPSPFVKAKHTAGHEADLWPAKNKTGPQWGLAIDLDKCTGCSACIIGCQSENNVPVVGKDEVLREREMHWIRLDRYFAGEGDEVQVAHQPMMCAHCGNAPCETVCPVLATVHSSDGLNQQVYNRCVGTRYCANNCPYKTRRFNWFDYPREDKFANLVLNPDVTVRSRGVMEKCSMCVQRIEEARIVAKQKGLPIADGSIRTACEQSCPAGAIVFGNMNDPKSRLSKLRRDPRHFVVLGELNVKPAVGYLESVKKA